MFELIIILSRYLFIFYLLYFLWQGVVYILAERGLRDASRSMALSKQRVSIVFMHLTAFLILAYIPDSFSFDLEVLAIGALGLILLLVGQFVVHKVYKHSCHLMWNGVFCLMDIGLITLQRLDIGAVEMGSVNPNLAKQQLIWFFVAFCAMLVIPLVLKIIPKSEKLEAIFLLLSFFLLALPLLIGDRVNGALNWVEIFGVGFQPSEMVKFLFVFYLASVFRKRRSLIRLIFPSLVSAALVSMLVMQRDLGGALIFFMTFMIMLYIATGSLALFSLGVFSACFASVLAYQFFDHIQIRVAAWINPWADIAGGSYQIVQSLFAIGGGGLLGSGLRMGMPNTIPVVSSDFIFSAICEEFGVLFAIAMIGVFMMIFYRGIHIALRCEKRYYSLLAVGFTAILAFQTFIIIGGVTKLIPMTGVTLPFISYGGSSVLVCTLMIGILQWVHMFNNKNIHIDEEEM